MNIEFPQFTDADKEAHRKYVSASILAAILNKDPWRRPIDIYRMQVEKYELEETPEYMIRGLQLEPIIGQMYIEETGYNLIPSERIILEDLRITCKPDFYAYDDKEGKHLTHLVQAKNTFEFSELKKSIPFTDDIPDNYILQGIFELGIVNIAKNLKLDHIDFATLIGGNKFRIFTVKYNDELFNKLVEYANSWLDNHIIPQIPPEIDSSKSYSDYLVNKYKKIKESIIHADTQISMRILELIELKDKISKLENRDKEIRNIIKDYIGENYGIEGIVVNKKSNEIHYKIIWYHQSNKSNINYKNIINNLRDKYNIPVSEIENLININTKKGKSTRILRTIIKEL